MVAIGYVGAVLVGTYQGITANAMELLSTTISTGVTSGGVITINANPALVDISPTTGWVVDYDPNGTLSPANPQFTAVNFPGATGVVLTGPPAQILTYWLISSSGTLVQQPTFPTRTQFRTHLCLAVSGQVGGVIMGFQQLPNMQSQPAIQLLEGLLSLGIFNVGANVISANGANLSINSSGGDLFAPGYGFPDYQDPNTTPLAAQSPITFHRATATAVLPAAVTTLDVGNYDPGGVGVITPIPNPPSSTTIVRVFGTGNPVASNQIIVQYGQSIYANLAAATAAVGSGSFIPNPLTTGGALLGWIAVTKSAVNLSDPTQATFTRAHRFSNP